VIAGVAALALIALAAFIVPGKKSVAQTAAPLPPLAAQAVTVAAPAIAPTPAPVDDAKKEVLVTVDPSDAKVLRDGQDLGSPPYQLYVNAGETITLVAKRPGYKDQVITLDDRSDSKRVIKLTPAQTVGAVAPRPKPAAAPSPESQPLKVAPAVPKSAAPTAASDFADPWKK
jgi:hypothetical protein